MLSMAKKSKTLFIDLHVHTLHSQEVGTELSPKDTLKYYQRLAERTNSKSFEVIDKKDKSKTFYQDENSATYDNVSFKQTYNPERTSKAFIRINDHDTIFGGVDAMEEFLANRKEYPNLVVIPGMECNVSLNYVLKTDSGKKDEQYPDSDEKYNFIFKNAHVGIAPKMTTEGYKAWKNSKDLIVYSKLAKMYVDLNHGGIYRQKDQVREMTYDDQKNLTNLGHQLLAFKNLIRAKYGVTIPFSTYYDCLQDGMNCKQIMTSFFDKTVDYMAQNYTRFSGKTHDQVKRNIKQMLAQELNKNSHFKSYSVQELYNSLSHMPYSLADSKTGNLYFEVGGIKRLNFDELCDIAKNIGAHVDLEHPDVHFTIHKNAVLPREYFVKTVKDRPISYTSRPLEYPIKESYVVEKEVYAIDFSVLSKKERDRVEKYIDSHEQIKLMELFAGDEDFKNDKTGMVKLQLFKKAVDKTQIKFADNLMGAELVKTEISNQYRLSKMVDIMAKNNIVPSIGYDNHMNNLNKYMLLSKDKPTIINKNGNEVVINKSVVYKQYERLTDKLASKNKQKNRQPKPIEKFYLETDKTQKVSVKNIETSTKIDKRTKEKIETNEITYKENQTYMDFVTSIAYLDLIFGKPVNVFENAVKIRPGAIIKELNDGKGNIEPVVDTFKNPKQQQVSPEFQLLSALVNNLANHANLQECCDSTSKKQINQVIQGAIDEFKQYANKNMSNEQLEKVSKKLLEKYTQQLDNLLDANID